MKKLLFLLLFSFSVVAFGASSYVPPLGWRQYMATNSPGTTTATNGVIGTNLIDNVGSTINGSGFTNGALTVPNGITVGSTGPSVITLYDGANAVVAGFKDTNFYGNFLGATNMYGTNLNNGGSSAGQLLTATATGVAWSNALPRVLGITVDGGGSAVSSGTKGYLAVPYTCTIQSCTIMADVSGSIEFRIWRTNSVDGSFPPTSVGAIGTNSLAADNYAVDSTLSNWTKTLDAGDVLGFNIPAPATTITRATLQLKVQP